MLADLESIKKLIDKAGIWVGGSGRGLESTRRAGLNASIPPFPGALRIAE